jgi:hypothetical protein
VIHPIPRDEDFDSKLAADSIPVLVLSHIDLPRATPELRQLLELLIMPPPDSPDVRINEVVTEIDVTEGVGPLSAAQVKQIVKLVLEHIGNEQHRLEQRTRDTRIHDRAFRPETGI